MKLRFLVFGACVLLACAPRPARADALAMSWAVIATPHVFHALLDLNEVWLCYLDGFRKRHPSPRPVPPRPDSLPASPVSFPDVSPGASTTAPAEF